VFAVLKLKFGFVKVRYRGLAKNANRLFVTCALVNLFLVRRKLMYRTAWCLPTCSCGLAASRYRATDPAQPRSIRRVLALSVKDESCSEVP